jgi:tetraacyldisaccharide 4'-kinase
VWITLRNKAYDWGILQAHRLPVKVVSIGNLSVGGTGKTPTAEYLIRWAKRNELKVAYLSRGYGRRTRGFMAVEGNHHTARQVGDEALQVASKFPNTPVGVCENRVQGVLQLHSLYPDLQCVILDDAFQHRRIHRDLDLILIDATRTPWDDYLLPLGRLREPFTSYKRADLILFNRVGVNEKLRFYKQKVKEVKTVVVNTHPVSLKPFNPLHSTIPVELAKGRVCVVFSGIGNPKQFQATLKAMGLQAYHTKAYPDHYRYREASLQKLLRRYKRIIRKKDVQFLHSPILITTEKDYIRLKTEPWIAEFADFPFYYVEIQMQVTEGSERLEHLLYHQLIAPQL